MKKEEKKNAVLYKEEQFLKHEEAAKEREIQSILMKADENKEEAITLDESDNIAFKNEVKEMLDAPIDNPQEKYDLYYMVIGKLLQEHLPKGKENKDARDFIYEQKNIFLTRGHKKDARGIRHADGRMAYNPDMKELVKELTDWIMSKGTMFELYARLKELNRLKGYLTD